MNPSLSEMVAGTSWTDLVGRIRSGQSDGMIELYELFSRRTRNYLWRHLGAQELDDTVHDTFVHVLQAIQRGELREPERLPGFVRTVSRRQLAARIDRAVRGRKEDKALDSVFEVPDSQGTPEQAAISTERKKLIQSLLDQLPAKDREILTRFYLYEQTAEQICAEMALTATQCRLGKSRAMARFGKLGRKKLTRRIPATVCLPA